MLCSGWKNWEEEVNQGLLGLEQKTLQKFFLIRTDKLSDNNAKCIWISTRET